MTKDIIQIVLFLSPFSRNMETPAVTYSLSNTYSKTEPKLEKYNNEVNKGQCNVYMDGLVRAGTRVPQVPVLLESHRRWKIIRSALLAPPINPLPPQPS